MQGMMGKLGSVLGLTSHSMHHVLSQVPGGRVLVVTFVISIDESMTWSRCGHTLTANVGWDEDRVGGAGGTVPSP